MKERGMGFIFFELSFVHISGGYYTHRELMQSITRNIQNKFSDRGSNDTISDTDHY